MRARKIRVGLLGVGNNSCAIVQGVAHYATAGRADAEAHRDGILFPSLCGYPIDAIVFSCAFDVDARKVGTDLHLAIFTEPNCYPRRVDLPAQSGVVVAPAPVLDGVPSFLEEAIEICDASNRHSAEELFDACVAAVAESETDVLLNFLPSGASRAIRFFADVALSAGCAFVNATATPIAHESSLSAKYKSGCVPLLGDDLESQFGSSLLHRTILAALAQRGFDLKHSYQVNFGGNTDFRNLSSRSDDKRRSKLVALGTYSNNGQVEILPSGGYLQGLEDHKVGYIAVEGAGWLGLPVTIDLKLKVNDSSNAAGIAVDLIRLAKAAKDNGVGGAVPLSYYFKNPTGKKRSTEAALGEVRRLDDEWRARAQAPVGS